MCKNILGRRYNNRKAQRKKKDLDITEEQEESQYLVHSFTWVSSMRIKVITTLTILKFCFFFLVWAFHLIPTRLVYSVIFTLHNIEFWNFELSCFPQWVTFFLLNENEDIILQIPQTNDCWSLLWFLSTLISFIHLQSRLYRFLLWVI